MKVISTLTNYIVDGLQLALGEVIEVEAALAKKLLLLPGVIKAAADLLHSEGSTPTSVSEKE